MNIRQRHIILIALTLSCFLLFGAAPLRSVQGQLVYRELRKLGKGSADTIAWSPDKSLFAVGGDGGIWLHKTDTFAPVRQITDRKTNALIWLPDGQRIAADGPDGALIYDMSTGQVTVAFEGALRPGRWSPDGSQWAFFTNDGEIVVCDARTLLCVTCYTAQKLNIGPGALQGGSRLLLWSPDGRRIASSDFGAISIDIWDAATGKRDISISDPSSYAEEMAWSPDGKWLLVDDSMNSRVRLWSIQTGQLAQTLALPGHYASAAAVAWNIDSTRLAVLTNEQTVLIWDMGTSTLQKTLDAPSRDPAVSDTGFNSEPGTGLLWSNRGLLASTAGSARLWDPTTGRLLHSLLDYQTYPEILAWSPDGHRLATAHGWGHAQGDGRLRSWDADAGELLCAGEGHHWNVAGVAWSPDGLQIAAAGGGDNDGADSRAIIWDGNTCRMLRAYDTQSIEGTRSVSWSPDGKRLAIYNQVWDVTSGQKLAEFERWQRLRWNPRSDLAASTDGKFITLWNLASSTQIAQWQVGAAEDYTAPIAWSPDGSILTSGDSEGAIKLWDAKKGMLLTTLRGQNDQINALAFSPDGKYIVCAGGTPPGYYGTGQSTDNTIRIWDAHKNQLLAVLVGHTGAIYSIGWSADGQHLASVSSDETIRVWEIGLTQ